MTDLLSLATEVERADGPDRALDCPDVQFASLPYVEFVELRANENCNCPEEEWLLFNVTAIIHFEPDGRTHVIFDAGDWDDEIILPPAPDYASARMAALDWVAALPSEEEIAALRTLAHTKDNRHD